MKVYRDQMNREVSITTEVTRIVSLVPSQTEYLYDLGLGNHVVGQTIFCIHPEEQFASAHKIGGTKKLHLDKIRALKPDLIIGNKEENDQGQIEELQKEFPVWMSDIFTYSDAREMMLALAEILAESERGQVIVNETDKEWERSRGMLQGSMLYLIWRDPYIAVGTQTFIHSLCEHIGFKNACHKQRYPQISNAEVQSDLDYILLSSEPFPFKQKHIEELEELNPQAKVKLIDGEICSWYGSRLKYMYSYFSTFKKAHEG